MLTPASRRDCGNCKDDGRPYENRMYPIVVSGMDANGTMRMAWECDCGSHVPAEAVDVPIPTPEQFVMARRLGVATTVGQAMQVVGEYQVVTAFARDSS